MATERDEETTKVIISMPNDDNIEIKTDEIDDQDDTAYGKENTDLEIELLSTENTASTISIVRPKFDIKSRSSLKSVLAEYGHPDGEEITKQRKKKKKKTKSAGLIEDDDDERDEQRRKAKQEHYLQVYEDVHKLRDYAYEDLMGRLADKVDLQRQLIRKKSEEIERNREEREEKERQERLAKKKKVQRIDLKHNDEFVKRMPKSQFYKLVSIEDRLKAKGILKCQVDIDDFWQSVRNPEVLDRYIKSALSTGNPPSATESLASASGSSIASGGQKEVEKERTNMDFRPMTQISEAQESSRPVTRDEWAVTQQAHAQYKQQSPTSRKRDPYAIARAAAQDLDRRFPMLELPPMACFNMDMGEKPPDPEEQMQEMKATRREKERQLFIKRLRKMYNLAQSNAASAHRIFEKHEGEFEMSLDGPSIDSLISFVDEPRHKPPPTHLPALDATSLVSYPTTDPELLARQPWLRHIKNRGILPIEEVPEESSQRESASSSGKRKSRTSSKSRGTKSASSSHQNHLDNLPPPAPALSLNSLTEHSKIMEAKCLSTFWPNYTGGSGSVFAK